jgi:hypothetical protein
MSQGFAVDMLGSNSKQIAQPQKGSSCFASIYYQKFLGFGDHTWKWDKKNFLKNKVYDSLSWDKSMVPYKLRFPYQRLFGSIAEISVLWGSRW